MVHMVFLELFLTEFHQYFQVIWFFQCETNLTDIFCEISNSTIAHNRALLDTQWTCKTPVPRKKTRENRQLSLIFVVRNGILRFFDCPTMLN